VLGYDPPYAFDEAIQRAMAEYRPGHAEAAAPEDAARADASSRV
jgi:hypothetical protein